MTAEDLSTPFEPDFDPDRRLFLKGALVAVGATLLAGCSFGGGDEKDTHPTTGPDAAPFGGLPELDKSREVDLLRDGTWQYMPGVSVENGTLKTHRTGLAVLELETPGRPPANPKYEADPPVNLYGTHIETGNDSNVGVVAHLSDIKDTMTMSLLGAPNIRYDERIERKQGIDLTIAGDHVEIRIYDTEGYTSPTTDTIALDKPGDVQLAVAQVGKEIHINANGQLVKLSADVFRRQVWFGFDGNATVRELKAYPINGNEIRSVDMSKAFGDLKRSPDGLASVAEAHGHKKLIGTAVDLAELVANPDYTSFIIQNFNEIETEMLAKFQALQPEEGRFEFGELDALVAFANEYDLTVHGHALMFTEAYPKWLWDKLSNTKTTEKEAEQLLRTHIRTVVSRYNGKNGHGEIKFWDVDNEWFDPDNWGQPNRQSIWYGKLGDRAADIAFDEAHKANPDAQLFSNDWGGESDPDRKRAMVGRAIAMKRRGVPISGVGFQCHYDEETLNDNNQMGMLYRGELGRTFAELEGAGLLVRISEASVAVNNDPGTQAEVYGILMETAMRANNCIGVNLWGATNSVLRYAYFTGDARRKDPGDDAPTTQAADGKITGRKAWQTLMQKAA